MTTLNAVSRLYLAWTQDAALFTENVDSLAGFFFGFKSFRALKEVGDPIGSFYRQGRYIQSIFDINSYEECN